MRRVLILASLVLLPSALANGQAQEKVLWTFGNVANDGSYPLASLISDGAGNLYGTTRSGGINDAGIIFELTPQAGGSWSETILYNFCSQANCTDGEFPIAGLVMDATGNLYGTTQNGGTQSACQTGYSGCGTVYGLSPQNDSTWAETVLYSFCSVTNGNFCVDGEGPNSQLIFDAAGNLYGTALGGNAGVVFELTQASNQWTESVLYNFCAQGGSACSDGSGPMGGVTFNKAGSLYGTTQHGGRYRTGTVFELSPSGNKWNHTILTSFFNGGNSVAPVSFDSNGNLYGTTPSLAFQLRAKSRTQGTRQFNNPITGANSKAGVSIDPTRSALFGTNSVGGSTDGGTSLLGAQPS